MGMDVFGSNATTEKGEYFRNNVWWWRPLWQYCQSVAPELVSSVNGDDNSGDGLNGDGASKLGVILLERIANGDALTYESQYRKKLAALPHDSWEASYPFEVENVQAFAEFLVDCGGFRIC